MKPPRLGVLLFAVSLAIVLLPAGGIYYLRIYQSVLVRRTEGDLLTQGALVAAAYREEVKRALLAAHACTSPAGCGPIAEYGIPATDPPPPEAERFEPVFPKLDLRSDPVLPTPPEAVPPAEPGDRIAEEAGSRLSPVLQDAQHVTLTGVRVLDCAGTVVGTSRSELGLSLAGREEVQGALKGETVTLLRERTTDSPAPALDSASRRSSVRVWVAVPVRSPAMDRVWGAVLLGRTPQDVTESLWTHRYLAIGSAVAILALAALVAILTSRLITRPVRELIRRTERVASGDRSAAAPLVHPGTREIALLSQAFARMARSLEERSDTIRSFASHVSHEFKTPLTSIRGAVELLRDHGDGMTPEERARFLANLEADTERLHRLTTRLLELARADAALPGNERADIAEVISTVAGRFRPEGLAIETRFEPDLPAVRIPPDSLEPVLANLLENARQHGRPGGKVAIAARRIPEGGVEITVTDDGPGISEANAAKVFDPFFTTARATGGTGLGLPIARALLTAHGGAISLSSRPGATTFRIVLPA